MPAKSKIVYTDSTKTTHIHLSSLKDYQAHYNKELKQFKKKKEVSLLHFYTDKNQYNVDRLSNFWFKDQNNMFSDHVKPY